MPFPMLISEAQAYGPGKFKDRHGQTDAVAFVRQVTRAPSPGIWRPGRQIMTAAQGTIRRGLAIATFDENGRYSFDKLGCHAAIYLSHDACLIWVLDQWPAQGEVKRRRIFFNVEPDTHRGADGKKYYVIE